jgi:Rrf2 family protein
MYILSRKTQYAIRALLCLASNEQKGGNCLGVRQIAVQTGVPKKWLGCIFMELRSAGIILSTRGKHGGYRLQHKPENISLARILSVTEVGKANQLNIKDMPILNGKVEVGEKIDFLEAVINDLRDAHIRILDRITLGELLHNRLK